MNIDKQTPLTEHIMNFAYVFGIFNTGLKPILYIRRWVLITLNRFLGALYPRGGGGHSPMWGDGVVPKFGVYFCHTISRIFGPFIERHGRQNSLTSLLTLIIILTVCINDFKPYRTAAGCNFFSKFIKILKESE